GSRWWPSMGRKGTSRLRILIVTTDGSPVSGTGIGARPATPRRIDASRVRDLLDDMVAGAQ
ncbi:hypothetical protein ACNJD8_21970, partial [Mycobacterium tuberculosis]